MSAETCEQHRAAAGWRCRECGALLCPDCATVKQVYPSEFPGCTKCSGMADALLRPRGAAASLAERIPGAFRWLVTVDGLAVWGGLVVVLTLASYLQVAFMAIALPAVVLTLFTTVRATGRGQSHVEPAEFLDVLQGVLMPLARLFLVFLPLWAPAALYLVVVGRGGASLWAIAALVALGGAWVPMAFLAAATSAGLLTLLNPVAIVTSSLRLGRDWFLYTATFGLLAVLFGLSLGVAALVEALPVPLIGRVLSLAVALWAPVVGARVAGLALFVHAGALGWGLPDEALEPVLGAVQPRGVLPAPDPTVGTGGRSYAPIELTDDRPLTEQRLEKLELGAPPPADAGHAEGAPLDFGDEPEPPRREALDVARLPPLEAAAEDAEPLARHDALDASALPSFERVAEERLRDAIEKSQVENALEEWRHAPAVSLSCAELSWLGRSAASKGEDQLAQRALEGAVVAQGTPTERSRAMVMLGRLCAERLSDGEAARRWMERVRREFPEESAATFASEWLAKRG